LYDIKTDYPHDIKNEIKLYTIDEESNKAHVIGSFSYRSGNSSDVDLFEPIARDDKKQVIKIFVAGIKRVVNNLNKKEANYFMEVKCGLDHLFYDINFGTCNNGFYSVSDEFFELMQNYKKFLSEKEFTFFEMLGTKQQRTQEDFERVKNIIRQHYIVRWNASEINRGYKILNSFSGTYKYTLELAVQEKSNINVEGIFINADNKYTDCSNFFTLEYKTKYGRRIFMNLSDKANDDFLNFRKEDLKGSMYTLLYSKLSPNSFKAAKRMFSYGIAFKDLDLMTRAYRVVNTQYGKLYTLTSQMKTILKVLQIHGKKHLYTDALYHHLDYIRWELENLILIDYKFSEVVEQLKMIIDKNIKLSVKNVIEMLDNITHDLSIFLNKKGYELMHHAGLFPLPNYLIPVKKPF
jgi:hypothetical protein